MIDTKELRQLAQAATLGGWYVKRGNHIYGCKEVTNGEEKWHPVIACTDDDEVNVSFEANAAFIAAANPAAITELLDRLEAAEKERELDEQRIADLMADLNRVGHENDTLRAKVAERERQEPVAEWIENRFDQYPQLVWNEKYRATIGAKLYTLPGAQTQGEEK